MPPEKIFNKIETRRDSYISLLTPHSEDFFKIALSAMKCQNNSIVQNVYESRLVRILLFSNDDC